MAEPTPVADQDLEDQPTASLADGPEAVMDAGPPGSGEPMETAGGDDQGAPSENRSSAAEEAFPSRSGSDGTLDETEAEADTTNDGGADDDDGEAASHENSGEGVPDALADDGKGDGGLRNDADTGEGDKEADSTEPLEIELPEVPEGTEVHEAEWTDTPVGGEADESPAAGVTATSTARGKDRSDPWALFANLEESLSLLAILSLALLSFTFLVIYRFNRIEGLQDENLFNPITILVGLAWAAFSLLGYAYLRNQPMPVPSNLEWGHLRGRLRQATLPVMAMGLVLGIVSVAARSESTWETLGPLWLGLLLVVPFLSLMGTGHISNQRYRPALLLTLGALILGPCIWQLGNTGNMADTGGPQFWDHREYLELETIRAALLLVGGAMVLGGTSQLRHPHEFYYPWTLGCIILAGVIGLRLGDLTFEVGILFVTAGGGFLIVGGLIGWQWRTREISQRRKVMAAGRRAMERGKPFQALSLLDQAFRLASRDGVLLDEPKLWAQKGAALSQQRKYRRALIYLGMALELDPNDELVWYERGKLYGSLKRWSGAVECYSRAVSLKHDYIEAWLALSEAHMKVNANQEARAAFGRVTHLAPRNIKGWLGLGRANAALGQVRQAVQAFDTASRIDAEAVAPYLAKAQVYYSLKLWEKAQQAYEMVIHLDPKSAEGWWKMAGCYLELRQPQMALNALNNYIDLEPRNVNGLLRRAALHYDEGEYGEAISDIHLAIEVEPENERALQLKRIVLSHLDSRGKWR